MTNATPNISKRPAAFVPSLAAAALALATGACVIRAQPARVYGSGTAYVAPQAPQAYTVHRQPPDPIYEQVTVSPGAGYVWVDGYWNWAGADWQWQTGHWVARPGNLVYVAPYYGSGVYVRGYWTEPSRVPRGYVVQPGSGAHRPSTYTHPRQRVQRDWRQPAVIRPVPGSPTATHRPTEYVPPTRYERRPAPGPAVRTRPPAGTVYAPGAPTPTPGPTRYTPTGPTRTPGTAGRVPPTPEGNRYNPTTGPTRSAPTGPTQAGSTPGPVRREPPAARPPTGSDAWTGPGQHKEHSRVVTPTNNKCAAGDIRCRVRNAKSQPKKSDNGEP